MVKIFNPLFTFSFPVPFWVMKRTLSLVLCATYMRHYHKTMISFWQKFYLYAKSLSIPMEPPFSLLFGNGLYLEHLFRLYCNLRYPLTYVCTWKMSSLCILCLSSWKKLFNFQLERICHSSISFRARITSVVYYRVWANTTKGS